MRKWIGLIVMMALVVTGCGATDEKAAVPEPPAQEATAEGAAKVVEAWEAAGLTAELMPDTGTKNVAVNMFGAENGYQILVGDQPVIVLEYDLSNLNGSAESFLKTVDEKGINVKTDEPAWRSGPFVLMGTSEASIDEHPNKDALLEAFQTLN